MKRITRITVWIGISMMLCSFSYGKKDERVCKTIINSYIQGYLESSKTGTYIKPYYLEDNDDTYIYNILGEINGKRVMLLNTKLKNYNYSINYKNLDFDGNFAKITVFVDVDYEYENGVKGGVRDIDYEFKLEKRDGGWIITNLESNYDEFQDFKNRVDEKKKVMRGETKEIIDSCRDDEIERIKNYRKKPSSKNVFGNKGVCGDIKTYLGVKYACEFALKNKNDRLFYTAGNSDCTNFVSQCIWASFGNYNPLDNNYTISNIKQERCMIKNVWLGNKYGGTTAWENVEALWSFILNKEGVNAKGINQNKPASDLNLNEISEGDIVQVRKRNDYRYSHSTYVTLVKREDGESSIYVSQHSYDKLNRNLEDLIFSWGGEECYMRIIKFVK